MTDILSKEEYNPTEKEILGIINRVRSPKRLHNVLDSSRAIQFVEDKEEVKSVGDLKEFLAREEIYRVVSWAYEKAYKRYVKKETRRQQGLRRRVSYLPEPTLYRHTVSKSNQRWKERGLPPSTIKKHVWRYDATLQPGSLIRHIAAAETKEQMPPVLGIRNTKYKWEFNGNEYEKVQIDLDNLDDKRNRDTAWLEMHGWWISRGKWAWHINSQMFKNYLLAAFPNAMDAAKYNHRLNAACVPGGFLLNCEMQLTEIWERDGTERIPSGKDGSGFIHPNHPIFDMMDSKPCPVQVTAINKDGWFVKGMLFVDDRAINNNGGPGILLDKHTIKGKWKKAAKKLGPDDIATITAHLGVLSPLRTKSQTVSWNFEQLENFKVNTTTKMVVSNYLDHKITEIVKGKLEKSIDRLEESSTTMGRMIRLLRHVGADPLTVPAVRKHVLKTARKRHTHLATGAGIQSPYLTVCADNTVKPGHVVINDPRFIYKTDKHGHPLWPKPFKHYDTHVHARKEMLKDREKHIKRIYPGTEVLAFRFPTILPQGILKLKVQHPRAHHRRNWDHNRHVCYMHQDTLLLMQGDDDGDQVALDARPELIQLLDHKIDNNIYEVEFGTDKYNIPTNSKEGRKYMRSKLREKVGLFTNLRSRLLAVGNIMAALACAYMIQQAVDSPTKKVEWIDYRLATNLNNYERDENGHLVFTKKAPEKLLDDGDLDTNRLFDWYYSQIRKGMRDNGITFKDETEFQILHKGIDRWRYADSIGGPLPYKHKTNLVGYCYNRFCAHYKVNLSKLYNMDCRDMPVHKLLPHILKKAGADVTYNPPMSWDDKITPDGRMIERGYLKGLRNKVRIGNYTSKIRRRMEARSKADGREEQKTLNEFNQRRISAEQDQLAMEIREELATGNLTLQDLCDAWVNEWYWERGSLYSAINACLWDGSPVLAWLDMEENDSCPDIEMLQEAVEWCIEGEQPFKRLSTILTQSTDKFIRKNRQIHHADECENCKDMITDALVNYIRINQRAVEFEHTKQLIIKVNKAERNKNVLPTIEKEDSPF